MDIAREDWGNVIECCVDINKQDMVQKGVGDEVNTADEDDNRNLNEGGDSDSGPEDEEAEGPSESDTPSKNMSKDKPRKRGRPRKIDISIGRRKYPPMRIYPHKVMELIENLNSNQIQWVRQSIFEKILDLKMNKSLDRFFLSWLSRRWNPNSRELKIRDDYIVVVDEEMIGWVLGLPFGDDAFEFEDTSPRRAQVKELKKQYECYGGVPYNTIYNACISEVTNRVAFLRHFIFFVLAVLLCTTKSNYGSPELLRAVTDDYVSESWKWNWSKFILQWMVKYNGEGTLDGVSGCGLILMIIYLDRLNFEGKGHRWKVDEPRLGAWQHSDVQKAIAGDRLGDSEEEFGRSDVVRDVVYGQPYPIGPRYSRPKWLEGKVCSSGSLKKNDDLHLHKGKVKRSTVGRKRNKRVSEKEKNQDEETGDLNTFINPRVDKLLRRIVLHPSRGERGYKDDEIFNDGVIQMSVYSVRRCVLGEEPIGVEVMEALARVINFTLFMEDPTDTQHYILCPNVMGEIIDMGVKGRGCHKVMPKLTTLLKNDISNGFKLSETTHFHVPVLLDGIWMLYVLNKTKKTVRVYKATEDSVENGNVHEIVKRTLDKAASLVSGISLKCSKWDVKEKKGVPIEGDYATYVVHRFLKLLYPSDGNLVELGKDGKMCRKFALGFLLGHNNNGSTYIIKKLVGEII